MPAFVVTNVAVHLPRVFTEDAICFKKSVSFSAHFVSHSGAALTQYVIKIPLSSSPPPRHSQSNSAQLMWSPKGGAVLALALSDVDATHQSYYGEQKLYYLAADGKKDCAVELPKSGPIHDVQWSPRGDYFVVVAGFMPAKAILFSHTCVPKFDLGK